MKNSGFEVSLVYPRNTERSFRTIPIYALVAHTATMCRKMYRTVWNVPKPKDISFDEKYYETQTLIDDEMALVCFFEQVQGNTVQRTMTNYSAQAELVQLLQVHYCKVSQTLSHVSPNECRFRKDNHEMLLYQTPEFSTNLIVDTMLIDSTKMNAQLVIDKNVVETLTPPQNIINYFNYKLSQIMASWDDAKAFDEKNDPIKIIKNWKQYATNFRAEARR